MSQKRKTLICSDPDIQRTTRFLRSLPRTDHIDHSEATSLNQKERSHAKAYRSISFILGANDEAIDDLLKLIDNWEAITGKPFLSDSHVNTQPQETLSLAQKAKKIIDERDWQYKIMPPDLRQEPYVRILIVLFSETLLGKMVASKSICIASGCPGTTALRYLDKLENYGLLQRVEFPSDRRVTRIELTSEGYDLAEMLIESRPA